MGKNNDKVRCEWCLGNELSLKYHDEEWGNPLHDDKKHFEYLLMEVMQCGLNWNMMLKKREVFRACFDDFDFHKIARYSEEDIERILAFPEMIRSRRKIEAIINNAGKFLAIISEFGSFDHYIWGFSQHKSMVYRKHREIWQASNELSDRLSSDMKKRGFKYLGSITVFSHLQACGIINDHVYECYKYDQLIRNADTQFVD